MSYKVLVRRGSPCIVDFGPDGPKSFGEYRARGEQRCPNYDFCHHAQGNLHPVDGHQCVMRGGLGVARAVLCDKKPFEQAMASFINDALVPAKGFIWSPDRQRFVILSDMSEALVRIEEYVKMVLDGVPRAFSYGVAPGTSAEEPSLLSEEELRRRNGGGYRFL